MLTHESADRSPLILKPQPQQNSLKRVELGKLPGRDVLVEGLFQQPAVDELFFFFVGQIRLDRGFEKLGILLEQEKMQLVARAGLIGLRFFVGRECGPLGHGAKRREIFRVAAECRVERGDPRQAVIHLEPRARDIRDDERAPFRHERDLLALREVDLRVEPLREPKVKVFGLGLRKIDKPACGVCTIDGDDRDALPRAEFFPLDLDDAVVIRGDVDEHRRGVGEEVEIGERNADRRRVGTTTSPSRELARSGPRVATKRLAFRGHLGVGLRLADGPRVQDQARPLEHVARKFCRELPIDDVAKLVANVATRFVLRNRSRRSDRNRPGRADRCEIAIRRMRRLKPRREHVDPSRRRGVLKINANGLLTHGNRLDRQRLGIDDLEPSVAPEHIPRRLGPFSQPNRDKAVFGFDPEPVVASRKLVGYIQPAMNREMVEAIGNKGAVTHLEEGHIGSVYLPAGAGVWNLDRLACHAVNGCRVGVCSRRQFPAMIHPLRARGLNRYDAGKGAERDSATDIGLEGGMHEILERSHLERELDRTIGLGLARFPEQIDDVRLAVLREVKVFGLVSLVDHVQVVLLAGGQRLVRVLALILHPRRQRKPDRPQPFRSLKLVGRLAVFKKLEVRHFLDGRNAVAVHRRDDEFHILKHLESDWRARERELRPHENRGCATGEKLLAVDIKPGSKLVILRKLLELLER